MLKVWHLLDETIKPDLQTLVTLFPTSAKWLSLFSGPGYVTGIAVS